MLDLEGHLFLVQTSFTVKTGAEPTRDSVSGAGQ